MLTVTFQLIHPYAKEPTRATDGSAGFDIYACERRVIVGGESVVVPTGLRIAMPDGCFPGAGIEAQVRGRSGLAFKRDVVCHVGTIDQDYRGEIGVKLWNLGKVHQTIKIGDRVAQLVFAPVYLPVLKAGKVSETDTERGAKGFGSSGE